VQEKKYINKNEGNVFVNIKRRANKKQQRLAFFDEQL
jgi:hypothetical protein